MLGEIIDNISFLLNIDSTIIPNIITFLVVITILYLSLKSQLSILVISMLYTLTMAILSTLGIDSVFNLFTLIGEYIL